ncbi:MAG: hypothetical protein FJ138_05765, partial [Deltaproteobacteria bacterium]|nr:hypothetical protein [Deltaproteobacteria bacterium]
MSESHPAPPAARPPRAPRLSAKEAALLAVLVDYARPLSARKLAALSAERGEEVTEEALRATLNSLVGRGVLLSPRRGVYALAAPPPPPAEAAGAAGAAAGATAGAAVGAAAGAAAGAAGAAAGAAEAAERAPSPLRPLSQTERAFLRLTGGSAPRGGRLAVDHIEEAERLSDLLAPH